MRFAGPWLTMAAAVWLSACRDGHVVGPEQTESAAIVSDPTPSVSASAASEGSAGITAATSEVVYVSMPPDSVPGAEDALIRNPRNGSVVTAVMVNGGLDPVPIAASAGDMLELEVRFGDSISPRHFTLVVPAAAKPRIVRTYPPPKKRDVPLNAYLVIVFTEPIEPGTLTQSTVELRQGTTVLAARIEFREGEGLTATIAPVEALAPLTDYQLVITQGIRDLDGEPLETSVTIEFTTGEPAGSVASVTLTPTSATGVVGGGIVLVARAWDGQRNELWPQPFEWSSSDAAVAAVVGDGNGDLFNRITVVSGRAPGSVTVTASSGGRSATATVAFTRIRFVDLSANEHVCGLTPSGEAFCWGANWGGALGNGDDNYTPWPVAVQGSLRFTRVSTGTHFTCGLTADGSAYCWGGNTFGQLGVAPSDETCAPWYWGSEGPVDFPCSRMPQKVSGGLAFDALAAGEEHACGLTASGQAHCWGANADGQLGNGTTVSASTPVAVAGGLTFRTISAGTTHTCGVTPGGLVYCWGFQRFSWTYGPVPVQVSSELRLEQVAAAWSHACGLTTDRAAYCWWGHGLARVRSFHTFSQIAAAVYVTCGLTVEGTVLCWDSHTGRDRPAPSSSSWRFGTLSRGYGGWNPFFCGVATDSLAYCWYGEEQVPTPREVVGQR